MHIFSFLCYRKDSNPLLRSNYIPHFSFSSVVIWHHRKFSSSKSGVNNGRLGLKKIWSRGLEWDWTKWNFYVTRVHQKFVWKKKVSYPPSWSWSQSQQDHLSCIKSFLIILLIPKIKYWNMSHGNEISSFIVQWESLSRNVKILVCLPHFAR